MLDWFRRRRARHPSLTLDQLVALGRAQNADYAERRAAQLSPERREHIRRVVVEGYIRPRASRGETEGN